MQLDEARSRETAEKIKSKPKAPFDNAHKAALATSGANYVQGFLAFPGRREPIEHSWIEVDEQIVDPTLPHLNRTADQMHYFPAQRLTVKQLKAAIEEAQEDYPEDDPLPIYGKAPYAYYGDRMLGGKEYQQAYEAALAKCKQLNRSDQN